MLLKIPSHRHGQPMKLPHHQLASMLARARELQQLGTVVCLLSEGVRESQCCCPSRASGLGMRVGWDLCMEGQLQTPGAAVSLQQEPARGRGALLLEGSLRTPRHLSHPDGAPKSRNKRCLPMRWFHPQLFISKS